MKFWREEQNVMTLYEAVKRKSRPYVKLWREEQENKTLCKTVKGRTEKQNPMYPKKKKEEKLGLKYK